MARFELLEMLAQGSEVWNDFRNEITDPIDFTDINLAAELQRLGWENATEGASLERYDLQNADFSSSDLTYITFSETDLQGTEFRHAVLDRASFANCRMAGSNFDDVNGSEASFSDLDLRGVAFAFSILERSWFTNCDLRSSSFAAGDLADTEFENCSVDGMSLRQVCYRVDRFEDRCFSTNLAGVRGISQEMLATMDGDPSVTLPEGLETPSNW